MKNQHVSLTPPPTLVDISVGKGVLAGLSYREGERPVVVAAEAVRTEADLLAGRLGGKLILLPPGEEMKSRAGMEWLEERLLDLGCGRETCLIGVGGGVVLDLVGFVAATYCRGVGFVSVPTTLLAMVDAAHGGKVGINLPRAKNYRGAFYHPRAIYCELNFFNRLPERAFCVGFAEVVKHGLIASEAHFAFVERHFDALLAHEIDLLEQVVHESLSLKWEIVCEDEREKGLRRILNFGHTVAHAIEVLSEWKLPHGEAVFWGMQVEARLSHQLGLLSASDLERIERLIERFSRPSVPFFSSREIFRVMKCDKKNKRGSPRFVALERVGQCHVASGDYVVSLTEEMLEHALCCSQNS